MSDDPFAHGEPTETLGGACAPPVARRALRVAVLTGPDAGMSTVLTRPRALIGRAAGADLRLADPAVSAFHAELYAVEHGVRVHDLGSRNGTLHAGARIERAVLPAGACLELGGTVLTVDLDQTVEEPSEELPSFGELRGRSATMCALFAVLTRLARTDLGVLIEGPTGTGKELAARALHAGSARASRPFVVLDCTAVPTSLAESVLFGHEKGAFTGAHARGIGVFEAAEGGTVFLDEVGELAPELQPKLLRVLERREVVPVGDTRPRPVQFRLVAATWRDLRTMINEGRFREDLYHRLTQSRVVIPPLAERLDDVPVLVEHFLAQRPPGAPGAHAIAPDALAELCARRYTGNVRELRNVVERAASLADGSVITAADLAFERVLAGPRERAEPPAPAPSPRGSVRPSGTSPESFKEAKRTLIDEFERDYLQRLLARTGSSLTQLAALAGIERHYLRKILRKHGLRVDEG